MTKPVPKRFLISICLIFSAVWTDGCRKEGVYRTEEISLRPSFSRAVGISNENVQSARAFVEHFVNAYRDTVNKVVPPALGRTMLLMNTNISAEVIFSGYSEPALRVFSSDKNQLKIDYSSFPGQFLLFANIGLDGSRLDDRL